MARTPSNKRGKRGGKPRRPPVDPLVAMQTQLQNQQAALTRPVSQQAVNSYISGATAPSRNLLTQSGRLAGEQKAAIGRIGQGTQNELGRIGTGLETSFSNLNRANQEAQTKSVQDLASQGDFLSDVLGGNFSQQALLDAGVGDNAQGVQAAASDRLFGQSAVGDIARSKAAAATLGLEAQRDAGSRWTGIGQGLKANIAGIESTRPYIRQRLQQAQTEDALAMGNLLLQNMQAQESRRSNIANEGIARTTAAARGDAKDTRSRWGLPDNLLDTNIDAAVSAISSYKAGGKNTPGVKDPRKILGFAIEQIQAAGPTLSPAEVSRLAVSQVSPKALKKAGISNVYDILATSGLQPGGIRKLMTKTFGKNWVKVYKAEQKAKTSLGQVGNLIGELGGEGPAIVPGNGSTGASPGTYNDNHKEPMFPWL